MAPAALLFKLFGPQGALGLATISFIATAVVALRLPSEPVTTGPADAAERAELRSAGVLLAASAMGLIRGIVGFLTLLLAFDFRQNGVPKWHFGVVAGVSVLGRAGRVGARAPHPQVLSEEQMLIGFLLAILGSGLAAIVLGDLPGACLLGAVVGVASTAGKLAFDSIVQRDAPDANRGRSFAKFETRFQIIWVVGALLGLIAFSPRVGFLIVSVGAGVRGLLLRHRLAGVAPPQRRAAHPRHRDGGGDRRPHHRGPGGGQARPPLAGGPDARAHGRAVGPPARRPGGRFGRRGRRHRAGHRRAHPVGRRPGSGHAPVRRPRPLRRPAVVRRSASAARRLPTRWSSARRPHHRPAGGT